MLLNADNRSREVAVIHRVLLFTPSIRKHIDLQHIDLFIRECVADSSPFKSEMLSIISKYLVVVILLTQFLGSGPGCHSIKQAIQGYSRLLFS